MSKKLKGNLLTGEEIATLIDQIAERIIKGDRSFDLQIPLTQAQMALAKLHHLSGTGLLNRLGLLLLNDGKDNTGFQYPGVKETIESLAPLDPIQDGNALHELANEIRNNKK